MALIRLVHGRQRLPLHALAGAAADVGGDDAVGQVVQRVVGRRGLRVEHVGAVAARPGPLFSAAAISAVLTISPRAQLRMITPGFIRAIVSARTRSRVSGVRLVCSEM